MATNRSPKTSLLEKIEAHWKSVLIIAGVFGGGFLVGKTYQKNESNIELSKIKSDADERLFNERNKIYELQKTLITISEKILQEKIKENQSVLKSKSNGNDK